MIDFFMKEALKEADNAGNRGSVPIGAIISYKNQIIAKAGNRVIRDNDPTAHAETLAIRNACSLLKTNTLSECDIYVTLEPCAMCAQAISLAKIRRVYFGAYSEKYGAILHGAKIFNFSTHKPEIIGGVLETKCSMLLKSFFQKQRTNSHHEHIEFL